MECWHWTALAYRKLGLICDIIKVNFPAVPYKCIICVTHNTSEVCQNNMQEKQLWEITLSWCAVRRFRTTYPISSRLACPPATSHELTTTFTAERCSLCWWSALMSTGHASSCVKFGLCSCVTGSVTIICPSNFASIVSTHCVESRTGKLHPTQWNEMTKHNYHYH